MNKKEILKKHMGEIVFSFHSGYNEIINTRTMIKIDEKSINKIAKRKQAYITPNNFVMLWDETRN